MEYQDNDIKKAGLRQTQGSMVHAVQPTFHMYSFSNKCFNCDFIGLSKVEVVNGNFTYAVCTMLVIFCCWLGCCLAPFYMDSCKDFYHRCSNCNELLAVKKSF